MKGNVVTKLLVTLNFKFNVTDIPVTIPLHSTVLLAGRRGTRPIVLLWGSHDGTAVPNFWDDANGPPPDVYNVPLTPGDLARTFERIDATTHPASYRTPAQGPLGVRLGRIVG